MMPETPDAARPWPFPVSELTAGLRRYAGEPGLRVIRLWEESLARRSATGDLRSLGVEVEIERKKKKRVVTQTQTFTFVVKEPVGTTRAGLAGVGLREVGVYRSLAAQLPVLTPQLIAADSAGAWLVMESLPASRPPDTWTADDYKAAIADLARLHDCFWSLEEDLSIYRWMGKPLTGDFQIHVVAAAAAVEKIVYQEAPAVIAGSAERLEALARLIGEAERVVAPLRAAPQTLLHGDYWPGNVSVLPDGRRFILDWQLIGLGPGVIDLLVFVNNSRWWFSALPVAPKELIAEYRAALAASPGYSWSDAEWDLLWDHALMWRFMQQWLDLLAAMPPALVEARADLLEAVWLRPVMEAIERRL